MVLVTPVLGQGTPSNLTDRAVVGMIFTSMTKMGLESNPLTPPTLSGCATCYVKFSGKKRHAQIAK